MHGVLTEGPAILYVADTSKNLVGPRNIFFISFYLYRLYILSVNSNTDKNFYVENIQNALNGYPIYLDINAK